MGEIKFRAWNKEEKRFLKLTNRFVLQNGEVWPSEYKQDKNGKMEYYHYSPEDVITMQYTGLKDRNGVEIYEGDILIDDEYPDEGISYATIEAEGCGFVANPWFTIAELNENADDYEVVGNIYENPELLEKPTN